MAIYFKYDGDVEFLQLHSPVIQPVLSNVIIINVYVYFSNTNIILGKIKKYSLYDLQEAVNYIKSGKMSQAGAARHFNIPRSVIRSRLDGSVDINKLGGGRSNYLPLDIENQIYEYIRNQKVAGLQHTQKEQLKVIGDFICQQNWKTPFKNNIPGLDWYRAFIRRHPKL